MQQVTSSNICLKCRGCCVFDKDVAWFAPVVAEDEHKRLLNLKGVSQGDFTQQDGKCQTRLVPFEDRLRCVFLDPQTWRCRVYFSRPFDCRFYPYVLMWSRDRKSLLFGFHRDECPAHDMKPVLEQAGYRQYVINYITSAEVQEKLRRSPELIWDFDEDFEAVHSIPWTAQNETRPAQAVNLPE